MPKPKAHPPRGKRRSAALGERLLAQADAIEVLASATRLDVLAALRAGGPDGAAQSVRELAHHLGRPPTALYHHMGRLLSAGLIEVKGQRRHGRRNEQLYGLVVPRLRARAQDAASRDVLARVGAALMRQMTRDHARALADAAVPAEGPQRRVGLLLLSLRLDNLALAELNAELDALFGRWAARSTQARGHWLRVALIEAPGSTESAETAP
jgi:DNA-binding transcriptional ArsR family regulator